jgi:GNAT superfamily N-acetyltransferase
MFSSEGYLFHVESLTESLDGIKPILAKNHEETGVYDLPFNPDYDRYLALDAAGLIRYFTARDRAGELAGFAIFFLDTEIYQKDVRSATQSINYVCAGHRGVGFAFMRFCDDILKKQGVNSVWRQASAKYDISKVYERMGYSLIEKTYRKGL